MLFFFLFFGRLFFRLRSLLLASALGRLVTHPFGLVSSVAFAPVEIFTTYDFLEWLALLGALERPRRLLARFALAVALVLIA